MFGRGVTNKERQLYEALIRTLEEEVGYLRAMVGIKVVEPNTEPQEDNTVEMRTHAITEPEEDLEWELTSGRLSLEEYEEQLRRLGAPSPNIKQLE